MDAAYQVVLADRWRDGTGAGLLHRLGQLDAPQYLLDVGAGHARTGLGQRRRIDVVRDHPEPMPLVPHDQLADHLREYLRTRSLAGYRDGDLHIEPARPDQRLVDALREVR